MNEEQRRELIVLAGKHAKAEGLSHTAIEQLQIFKVSGPSGRLPDVYRAALFLIVQGKKEVMLGEETYVYTKAEFLVVSVDLPVIGHVTVATAKKPYLCLQVDIDSKQLSDLIAETGSGRTHGATTERGLFLGKTTDELTDGFLRLARLLDVPRDIPTLAPMVVREIYYRLLAGPFGGRIAQMAINGTRMQRIAHALQVLKHKFAEPLRVESLAEMANMSPSSFHHHFKAVTAMSPLQYQKRLRLLEARRLLLVEGMNAAAAAYKVGYESPSQFSREYSRMFGVPPISDVTRAGEGVLRLQTRV